MDNAAGISKYDSLEPTTENDISNITVEFVNRSKINILFWQCSFQMTDCCDPICAGRGQLEGG